MLSSRLVKEKAKALGFSACGIAPVEEAKSEADYLAQWLAAGCHAGMTYMENHRAIRLNPAQLLEGAKSVISVALNYYPKQKRDTNLSFKDNFPRIFGDKAYEAYERYREIYKSIAASRIIAFPSAKEVIEFFKSRGIILMIVTNKERCLLEYELPLLYKKEDFAKIVCGHEAPRDKPHGDQALFALKGFINREEISPETVWIVGDSPQDSNSALEINALPIRINRSIWGDEGQKEDKIVYFSGFPEFLSALKLAKN